MLVRSFHTAAAQPMTYLCTRAKHNTNYGYHTVCLFACFRLVVCIGLFCPTTRPRPFRFGVPGLFIVSCRVRYSRLGVLHSFCPPYRSKAVRSEDSDIPPTETWANVRDRSSRCIASGSAQWRCKSAATRVVRLLLRLLLSHEIAQWATIDAQQTYLWAQKRIRTTLRAMH